MGIEVSTDTGKVPESTPDTVTAYSQCGSTSPAWNQQISSAHATLDADNMSIPRHILFTVLDLRSTTTTLADELDSARSNPIPDESGWPTPASPLQ